MTTPQPGPDGTWPQQPIDQPTLPADYPGAPGPTGAQGQPYAQPGYAQPGYAQPGQPQPGYAQSGYAQPGFPPPGAYPGYGPQNFGVDAYGRPLSDKSKVVAGILQLVLGFGIGRFYIGDTSTGIWQIVVTLLTCGIGHVWSMIDGILILVNGGVDAQGRVLRD